MPQQPTRKKLVLTEVPVSPACQTLFSFFCFAKSRARKSSMEELSSDEIYNLADAFLEGKDEQHGH